MATWTNHELVEAVENSPEMKAAREAYFQWFRAKMLEGSPFLRALAEEDEPKPPER